MSNNNAEIKENLKAIKDSVIAFAPGALVVMNTHPYSVVSTESFVTFPFIKDFPVIDSPVMVVGESLKNFKDVYDENTGELKTNKGSSQCKCIWFNHKSGSFEETWLSSNLLKVLNSPEGSNVKLKGGEDTDASIKNKEEGSDTGITIGSIVSLKSLPIEKRKLSRLYESRSSPKTFEMYKLAAIHNYEPPVMEVIETRKNELSTKFDMKTGKKKKYSSEINVKCKWFNSLFNKFSEVWLPVDVLIKRKEVDMELLSKIQKAIVAKEVFKTHNCLFKPSGLNSDGFYWNVEGINLFTNTFMTISIFEIGEEEPIKENTCFSDFVNCKKMDLSFFQIMNDEEDNEDTLHRLAIKNEIEKYTGENAIRILYKNLKGKVNVRVLTDYRVKGPLLIGYCHLREAERNFDLLSIKTIEKVNFRYNFIGGE